METITQSIKELIRHAIYKIGGKDFIRALKKIKGVPSAHLNGKNNAERFSSVYDDKVWGAGGENGSLSGPGSDKQATKELVRDIEKIFSKLEVKNLVDVGCGDFGWMRLVDGEFHYVGVDVVRSVISDLSGNYGSNSRTFIQADAAVDGLPVGDTALCREVLFHLSFKDIWGVIANLKRHGYIYLIATSDKNTWFNSDITSGDHRALNLLKAPFKFPDPIYVIKDDKVAKNRIIGVWRLAEINLPVRRTRGVQAGR